MRLFRSILLVQATYTFITAVWPIVHIQSFMDVSGYKRDVWLVKTVAAILIPVALCLMTYRYIHTDRRPALVLGGLLAFAFIIIDFYYSLTDVIADVYMVDGFVQIAFLSCWIYVAVRHKAVLNS
jgi:hypothetical protein